jgi:thiamine-phosphate pyrophosphorylase
LAQERQQVQGNGDTATGAEDRCRLVLIVPAGGCDAARLESALAGGDVASIVITPDGADEAEYQKAASSLVPVAQAADVAALVVNDSRAMGRSEADGMLVEGSLAALEDAIARFSPKRIVGFASLFDRHGAMEAGERNPDFLFLGKTDGDIRPEAHPRNLKIAEWAAEVMQVSLIVMGGNSVESVIDIARTGADFAALGKAVFAEGADAGQAVKAANALLDEHAPRFESE